MYSVQYVDLHEQIFSPIRLVILNAEFRSLILKLICGLGR